MTNVKKKKEKGKIINKNKIKRMKKCQSNKKKRK